ncbi:hypothetical protein Bca4012_068282 [Brassica carinata]|uniref:Uncharacterized protein n=1 Tax=Brassica carinata TaxID=52824 RepID=A0A8X7VSQ5_BRACI|nr:hypothetical protein Bca52824_020510 [Brassica carinata]
MESPKIFLQPFNLSAAEDVLKWAGDDDVTCYLCWDSVKTIEEAIPHGPHPWRRSISLLDDGRSIGCVSIRPDPGDGSCRPTSDTQSPKSFGGGGY